MMRYWESWESQGENTSLCINELNNIIVVFPFLVCCPGRFSVKSSSKPKDVVFYLLSLAESHFSVLALYLQNYNMTSISCHTCSTTTCVDLSPAAGTKRSCLDKNATWLGDGKGCMFQKYKGTENYSSSTGHKVAIIQMRSFMVSQPFYCWPTLYQQ